MTAPHQTVNQTHPTPRSPHATQPDSAIYCCRWFGLGLALSRFVETFVRTPKVNRLLRV